MTCDVVHFEDSTGGPFCRLELSTKLAQSRIRERPAPFAERKLRDVRAV
jgi:hypothetical protein